jgi:hypothetical protein
VKKKIALVLVICTMAVMLYGCSGSPTTESFQPNNSNDYFITIENCGVYTRNGWSVPLYIVYARDTHVKYIIGIGGKKSIITPLYNADGTLQIYEEK